MNVAKVTDGFFKDLLDGVIVPELKAHGLGRRGNSFYLRQDNNVGLINFQLSMKTSAHVAIFTVNLGVASGRLSKFFNGSSRPAPQINDCHWRQRLGFLLPERKDKWWQIANELSTEQVGNEVCADLIAYGLPEISRYLTDEGLRNLWLSGQSPGLTDLSRLMNLSVLINEIGPRQARDAVLAELRQAAENGVSSALIERHLKRLG